ncbi:4-hydroxythreonine-4-phosphate dehydrogenase PdxA [Marinoscillum sp. MHG1-6]|uniref:4-hydroxythreonine-4-phosphate dehydrogenase PdxA n=1 Tax=Marinoscillum sp. MHG1-6 TaxID=2959627 RepID=UPI0021589AD7|nr:4-hydroxythreonine-4-phosphate dehydrogenase PdxA [Marinoscillum sp. MHG1-6]
MRDSSHSKNNNPIVGISVGDYNGVGPEVILKTLMDNRVYKFVTPVVYCDARIMAFYRKELGIQNLNYNQINSADQIKHRKFNLLNVPYEGELEITPGQGDKQSGSYALKSLQSVMEDLKKKKIDALCTAPLSKDLVQSDEFNFPGHTEYLTQQGEAQDSLMLLVNEDLRVGVVTGHIPIKEVSENITKKKVKSKLKILLESIKKDFGIKKPKIAILGLNPHAGENGLLGSEENDIITPVIEDMKNQGNLVFGPFPADGFFGSSQFKAFDGILAMYHDQGLIPFKNMAFESGVNFTAGLPFVRTSPDHGTAFSLAGKNEADPTSFRNALFYAKDIVLNRAETEG